MRWMLYFHVEGCFGIHTVPHKGNPLESVDLAEWVEVLLPIVPGCANVPRVVGMTWERVP